MNNKKAKAIRKALYGDFSTRNRNYKKLYTGETVADDMRQKYQSLKKSFYQFPEVIRPAKIIDKKYIASRALLHLRKHFTTNELCVIFHRSKKFIYSKLKEFEAV